jgi:hypothetical protein
MRRLPTAVVVLLQAVAVLAVTAGAGAVAGVVWEHFWTAPVGQVQQGQWALVDETGLRADFAGIGLYVVVAAVAGLVVGVLTGLVLDRAELVSLVVLALSALLAGWLMWKVGAHRGPPDPRPLAAGLADGTRLPGDLRLHSRVPFVSFPLGSVLGFALVLLAVGKRGRTQHDGPDDADPRPVDPAQPVQKTAFRAGDAG